MRAGSLKGQVSGNCDAASVAGGGRGEAPLRTASTGQLAGLQETHWLRGLQTAVTAQRLPSTQELVETQPVNTQRLQPLGHLVLGSSTGGGGMGCRRAEGIRVAGGSGRMRTHTKPVGSPQTALSVIYDLIQMTVSDLEDLIYFISFMKPQTANF